MQADPGEVVESIYAAWNAGDWGLEHIHPDVEWDVSEVSIDERARTRGRDALLAYWRRFWEAWKPGARWEVQELARLDDDRVLASGELRAVGRSSGLEMSTPFSHLWTVEDGVVVGLVVREHRSEA